ncbi:MAG: hypothetical protein BJ554DRAFT_7194 [Olpidium bornovanus]|uniref:Uncharacterized protein n=1 Tax=Olpidium bornovanus TaxID=278681 RepID=A0A8H7ZWV1_9FUNG|nr:MAG: hypothetical protein BJ554DRAFT_7194 [Olpidium bornovanus]
MENPTTMTTRKPTLGRKSRFGIPHLNSLTRSPFSCLILTIILSFSLLRPPLADGEWDDEENVETEESAYVEWLAAQASANIPEDGDSDDENDWTGKHGSDLEEELDFESPLDDLDVYCRFQEAFNNIQARGTSAFAYLTNQLPCEHQAVLQNVIETANRNRAAATAKAAEQA